MKKEDKKERQQLRHQLQAKCKASLPLGVRFGTTIAQQNSMAKTLCDRLVSAAVADGARR